MKKKNNETDDENNLMDPKIDFAFKELFGHNPTNFIHLANAILNLKGDKMIQSVTFLNLEMSKDKEEDRGARLDVLAKLQDGSFINIEMQCADYKDFEKRSTYYFSKIYSGQLKKKQDFCDLKPVVIINLLDFIIFDDEEDFHSPLIIANAKNHKRGCKDFEMHFIEIPKIAKTCYNTTDPLEMWVLFFKEPQEETLKELAMHSQEIAQAFESLEVLSKNKKKRAEYEARKKALLDIRNGMRVNMEEGVAKGKMEEKLEMARNLKALGVPMDTIMKASGLSLEQVKEA